MTKKFTNDIQLINVSQFGDIHHLADWPYGMALITAYLRDQGFKTLMLQYPADVNDERFLTEIIENPSYLYGFQTNFENYPDVQDLVKIIKENNPEAKIVFGGPFIVSFYKELLKNDPNLDAVILGEGEYTTAELAKYLKEDLPDWQLINGLARCDENGEIVLNGHRPAIKDLDAMPFAARDLIENETYDIQGKLLPDLRITTSRGCTSDCTFCAVNVNSKWQRASRWRGRDPINVVDEIQELTEKYNAKLINLQDSAFDDPGTLGPKRNRIFCEEILKRGIEISMKAYMRAHSIKEDPDSIELYKLYKEAGIDFIIIGAEAGSDEELEIYGKDANLEDNNRAFRVLEGLDLFGVHTGFIMFGPYSTLSMLRENIQFLWENKLGDNWSSFKNALVLTHGSAIVDQLEREGRLLPRKNFWEYPDYDFIHPEVLKLAKHVHHLREVYPGIDISSSLALTAMNLNTRLKNKMNKNLAAACEKEVDHFREVYHRVQSKLNDLLCYGFLEMLERVEKDGVKADLMRNSETYFGKDREEAANELQDTYNQFLNTVEEKGFGLGGLVFNQVPNIYETRTDVLDGMKSKGFTVDTLQEFSVPT